MHIYVDHVCSSTQKMWLVCCVEFEKFFSKTKSRQNGRPGFSLKLRVRFRFILFNFDLLTIIKRMLTLEKSVSVHLTRSRRSTGEFDAFEKAFETTTRTRGASRRN